MRLSLCFLGFVALALPAEGASIRSAYLGVNRLAANSFVTEFCGNVDGRSAMPLTLSERVLSSTPTLNPSLFRVTTNRGVVTPKCATLEPAYGAEKNLTILLVGDFANQIAQVPGLVEIVGDLPLEDGTNARGLSAVAVIPSALSGARLVDVRVREVEELSSHGCPDGTSHVAILVFEGGQSGIFSTDFGQRQIRGTSITTATRTFQPPALGGDADNDNFVNACLSLSSAESDDPIYVTVDSGTYFDPANRPNVRGVVGARRE